MNNYQGVSLPKQLLKLIEEKTKGLGYTNKVDFIREAIREKLDRMEE